jgi:hypothetical protein
VRAWLIVVVGGLAARSAWGAPCPASTRQLLDLAGSAFSAEQRTVVDRVLPLDAKRLRCREVRGPTPLALLTYAADDGVVLGALVSGDTVVWSHGSAEDCTPCLTDRAYAVADLDGDGRDELLVHVHKTGHMSTSAEWLELWTLDGRGVPTEGPSLTVRASASNQGSEGGRRLDYACVSTWRVLGGPAHAQRIELVGSCTGPAASQHDYARGRQVFTLRDGQLVQAGT